MPSSSIVHVIGTTALIGVMLIAALYSLSIELLTYTSNSRTILKHIAETIALDISKMLMRGENMTLLQLNFPLESYSRTGYNVYIGIGDELVKNFPAIGEVLAADPEAGRHIFVVASLPAGDVYEYALAVNTTLLKGLAEVNVALGDLIKDFNTTGYSYSEAYQEDGTLWLCRAKLRVDELSNTSLSNYVVRINFNPENLSCIWKGITFKPTFDDVRFTDEKVNPLDYYIDPSEWRHDNATVWVRVDRIEASSYKYIYMYWGTMAFSTIRYRGNPSRVFLYFANFTEPGSLTSWFTERGEGTASCTQVQNTTGLYVNASYISGKKDWENSYCNLVLVFKDFSIQANSQGVIVESFGGPRTTLDQDFRIGLYDRLSRNKPLYVIIQPPVIDPVEDMGNFTVIWGSASIASSQLDRVLLLENTERLEYSGSTFFGGLVTTNNTAFGNFPEGHEAGQLLVRIKPLNTTGNAIYGVLLTPKHVREGTSNPWNDNDRGVGVGFRIREEGAYWNITPCEYPLKSSYSLNEKSPANPDNWNCRTDLSVKVQKNGEAEWIYLHLTVKAPGNALQDLTYSMYYNALEPIVQNAKFSSRQLGNIKISEVGFITASSSEEIHAYFDMLLTGTYSEKQTLPDYRYINFTGLPPEMYIELSEYDEEGEVIFSAGNTTQSGWAIIDVLRRPILGVLGQIVISIYQGDYLVYQIIYDPREENNQYLSGGMKVELYLGLNRIDLFKGVELRASRYINGTEIRGNWWTLLTSLSPKNDSGWNYDWKATSSSYNSSFTGYVALALFNNTIYSFINSSTPVRFEGFDTTGEWALLIGIADGSINNPKDFNTAYYKWLRVRPFVNPEPSASLITVESMREYNLPMIRYDVKSVVVFSSSHVIDIAAIILNEGGVSKYLIVVINRGLRGP